jgi:hypothetical protein
MNRKLAGWPSPVQARAHVNMIGPDGAKSAHVHPDPFKLRGGRKRLQPRPLRDNTLAGALCPRPRPLSTLDALGRSDSGSLLPLTA